MRLTIRIIFGIILAITGYYLMRNAYELWQVYFSSEYKYDLSSIILFAAGSIIAFFLAALLLIGDKSYTLKSLQKTAFATGILVPVIYVVLIIIYAGDDLFNDPYGFIALIVIAIIALPVAALSWVLIARARHGKRLAENNPQTR